MAGINTVTPNGQLIEERRRKKGWSRETFSEKTAEAVEHAALNGGDLALVRRYKESRRKKNKSAGLGLTTLRNLAKGKNCYPLTLRIAAMTLGVDPEDLIITD